ncbi:hypothetical protein PM082_021621 [Marasmius tenuissimus]|nr:hypothetical protein PM082_021621 [Marasmius tenuissimus]
MPISLIDLYELVAALAGTVFSVTLIINVYLHGEGNFRETRRKRASMTYKARLAERRRIRELKAKEKGCKAVKQKEERQRNQKLRPRDPTTQSIKMVRVLSSFSREMARELSNSGQWRVREIEVTQAMLRVSRPLASNPAICSGW